jgi:hypothetical protein
LALITRTLPALLNGISQQPAILRSADQTEDELNTWSRIAEGVSKRPPTQVVAKLTALTAGDTYSIHHINRDVSERYLVIIKNGAILVFDETTGAQKTVNAPRGWGYLDTSGDVYRAMSIADYTFIVNTTKKVALKGAAADQTADNANNRWLGGSSPRGFDMPAAGYTVAGALLQYRPNPTYSGGLTGTVPSPDKLPTTVCSGCVYKVLGDNGTAFVSYYVMGDGTVWNETVAPGLKNAIDETTMPWALVRESDGTFTFAPFSWKPRRVGDNETNPPPTFINRTIRDVFFYQNRLGFAVDDGVIFSGAGDYGDFWRQTVLDYIDSDTLAASAATTDVALIDYALPFSDGVMLFSRQRQFALTNGDSGLSAHSIAITPVTNYLMAQGVRPTPMGSQAHFCAESRGFVSVQEYTRLTGANPNQAADVTAHVPHLIPQGASQLIPMDDLKALVVLTHGAATNVNRKKAFVYQFFWDADKKLQSAWRVWSFGDGKPVTGAYESGSLFLVMERTDGVYLEKIDLNPSTTSTGQNHIIYLDRQVSPAGVYNAGTGTTTFTLGYAADPATFQMVRGSNAAVPESIVDLTGAVFGSTTVTVEGDESGHTVTCGQLYTKKVVLSEQFPLDWQNRPLTSGRLQVHACTVNLTDTAYLRAVVYPYGLAAYGLEPGLFTSAEFSPQVIWSPLAILGQRAYATQPFTFSVAGHSKAIRIELINDTAFESTITSAEWEGLFFSRAQ